MHSLFNWDKGQDRTWKSELLLNLKGGQLPETLKVLARQLVLRSPRDNFENVVWVPAPARVAGVQDHAFALAESLQDAVGGKLISPLVRTNTDEQKKKSKDERAKAKMKRLGSDDFVADLRGKETIFVDDLIASGSTVNAAYLALSKPSKFEAWALAHRPKLAENRGE